MDRVKFCFNAVLLNMNSSLQSFISVYLYDLVVCAVITNSVWLDLCYSIVCIVNKTQGL